jgi:hypothetical protein
MTLRNMTKEYLEEAKGMSVKLTAKGGKLTAGGLNGFQNLIGDLGKDELIILKGMIEDEMIVKG